MGTPGNLTMDAPGNLTVAGTASSTLWVPRPGRGPALHHGQAEAGAGGSAARRPTCRRRLVVAAALELIN